MHHAIALHLKSLLWVGGWVVEGDYSVISLSEKKRESLTTDNK